MSQHLQKLLVCVTLTCVNSLLPYFQLLSSIALAVPMFLVLYSSQTGLWLLLAKCTAPHLYPMATHKYHFMVMRWNIKYCSQTRRELKNYEAHEIKLVYLAFFEQ